MEIFTPGNCDVDEFAGHFDGVAGWNGIPFCISTVPEKVPPVWKRYN